MSKYRETQRTRQISLIKSKSQELFSGDEGGGKYNKDSAPSEYILQHGENNLYKDIREKVVTYFSDNRISWWGSKGPTGHILSSQIACLNHLFAIREEKQAVLDVLNGIGLGIEFSEVLPIACDKEPRYYIGFEVVSKEDHLNEKRPTRGTKCTSVDALIYAVDTSGKRWLIPIEWKYTEFYHRKDLSNDDRKQESSGSNGRGKERLKRYTDLINKSKQLKSLSNYEGSIYYQEPFYQLMRQTLWAENMVNHSATEHLQAEDYIHIHVVPSANTPLRDNRFHMTNNEGMVEGNEGMVATWKGLLQYPDKYVIITPEALFAPIKERYAELTDYLSARYWDIKE